MGRHRYPKAAARNPGHPNSIRRRPGKNVSSSLDTKTGVKVIGKGKHPKVTKQWTAPNGDPGVPTGNGLTAPNRMTAPQELLMAKIMTLVPRDLIPLAITTPTRRVLEVPQGGSPSAHHTRSLPPISPALDHPAPTVDDRGL